MKINYDYLATLLNVFLDSEKAHVSISDIERAGIEVGEYLPDDNYIFHMQLLMDSELISNADGEIEGLMTAGILMNGDGSYRRLSKGIRLTQKGHDFAKSLNDKEILLKIKSELKNAPFKAVFDGGQRLLEHFAKKKIDNLINPD